jgi:hypothetical protein
VVDVHEIMDGKEASIRAEELFSLLSCSVGVGQMRCCL